MDGRNNLEGENMKYMRHYLWFVLIDGIFSITDSRAKKVYLWAMQDVFICFVFWLISICFQATN